jgi:hypothetical protein
MTIEEIQDAIRRFHYCEELMVVPNGERIEVQVSRVKNTPVSSPVVRDGIETVLSPEIRAQIVDLVAADLARQRDEARQKLTDLGVSLS